jgi:hypothetical protein
MDVAQREYELLHGDGVNERCIWKLANTTTAPDKPITPRIKRRKRK